MVDAVVRVLNNEVRVGAPGQGALMTVATASAAAAAEARDQAVALANPLLPNAGEPHSLVELLSNGYDNTPRLTWTGKRIGWVGDSKPHEGGYVSGYPERVGWMLGARVVNRAWAGSHPNYGGEVGYAALTTYDQRRNWTWALSMTEADRLAGLALYGTNSGYADGFDTLNVTLPSEQTCDHRILETFKTGPVHALVLDHGHNINQPAGILNPPAMTITGVTLGATTTFTVSALDPLLAVGDGFGAQVFGIDRLGFAAGRVQAINTTSRTITVALDSTGYTGSLATTGNASTCVRLDRSTYYGANNFLIYYTLWAGRHTGQLAQTGQPNPDIILVSSASLFTENVYKGYIYDNARHAQALSVKWYTNNRRVCLFDAATKMAIAARQNNVWNPDGTHPNTPETRQAYANHFALWMMGGAHPYRSELDYLKRGRGVWRDGLQVVYDAWSGGGATPSVIIKPGVTTLSEDFVSVSEWTPDGSPTTGPAPWDASKRAATFNWTSGAVSLKRTGLAPQDTAFLEFDLYLPSVTMVPSGIYVASVVDIANDFGDWLTLGLAVNSAQVSLQLITFTDNGSFGGEFYDADGTLTAGTHRIRLEAIKETVDRAGAVRLMVDGVEVIAAVETFDLGVDPATFLNIGVPFTNMPNPFSLSIGNLTYGTMIAHDNTTRVTESLRLADGRTLKLLDGVATAITGTANGPPLESIVVALSDETTAISTGTAKVTMRMPYPFVLTGIRASLGTASSSGLPTVNVKKNGGTILSTKLTINATAKTSIGATTPVVISTPSLASDDEIAFDIDVAGTGAKGLKVTLIGYQP